MTRFASPLLIPEQTAPATPPTGWIYVYGLSDGKVYRKDDAGVQTELGGGGAAADTDDIEFLAWWGAF